MPADNLSCIFDDRDIGIPAFTPLRVRIDIADLELEFPLDERQQLFDKDFAKMAALPAVDSELAHWTAPASPLMTGVNCLRQFVRRNRLRPIAVVIATAPSIMSNVCPSDQPSDIANTPTAATATNGMP